jgi:hypothetical protein
MDPKAQELIAALVVVAAAAFVVVRLVREQRARRCPACAPETPRVARSGVRPRSLNVLPPT